MGRHFELAVCVLYFSDHHRVIASSMVAAVAILCAIALFVGSRRGAMNAEGIVEVGEAGPADVGMVGGGEGAPGGGAAGEAAAAEVAVGGGEAPAADPGDGDYGDAPAAGGVWAAATALGDAAGDERAAMLRRQRELREERRRLQMDLNNANRRRTRLLERARGLTDADLLDILSTRAAAKAKAKAKPKPKAKAAAKGKALLVCANCISYRFDSNIARRKVGTISTAV